MFIRKQKAVPKGRAARLTGLAGFAGKVATSMVVDGSKKLLSGERPELSDLLLQPKHAQGLTQQLSTLRGAAMKMGQMLSMDSGALLPPEWANVLASLQSQAYAMPATQLIEQLERDWGADWQTPWQQFSFDPVAAASIGQVHRGRHHRYGDLAIKVQYPGVKPSIDSDIDNLVGLLRMSRMVPSGEAFDALVSEAKQQLHKEADYRQEAAHLTLYRDLLNQHFSAADQVRLPKVFEDLSSDQILAMSYVQGSPLDKVLDQGQAAADELMTLVFRLFFCEFWQMHAVQTDPNLGNFQFDSQTGQLVLLDFGALRCFEPNFVADYTAALVAARDQQHAPLLAALEQLGFFSSYTEKSTDDEHKRLVAEVFMLAAEPLRHEGAYDFGQAHLPQMIRNKAISARLNADNWHSPPIDVLFLHRKMAGLYLMAAKLKAKVDVKRLFEQSLKTHTLE